MNKATFIVLAAGFAFMTGGVSPRVETAEAATVCKARMVGQGTGMGIAGQGSALARANALSDWASKVRVKYGSQYSYTAKARSVRYDCRQGAILEAKCVVSAVPCADVATPKKKKRR